MIRFSLNSQRLVENLTQRSYSQLFLFWIGSMFLFGILYWILNVTVGPVLTNVEHDSALQLFLDSLYFSVIAGTSTGFGDIAPTGLARILTSIQAVLLLPLFSIFVARLVATKSDSAIQKMYRHSMEHSVLNGREQLFIVRKDIDIAIESLNTHQSLSMREWDNTATALMHAQNTIEKIPELYDTDLPSIDDKREKVLIEAVERTAQRIRVLESKVMQHVRTDDHTEDLLGELREWFIVLRFVCDSWAECAHPSNRTRIESLHSTH